MTDTNRPYHTSCTGLALATVNNHQDSQDITLFGSCFCPFVQRVWLALEFLGVPYKYYEVDPYKKPQDLLELSPKGLVPALRFENYQPPRGLNESTVILEYLEDLASNTTNQSLLPPKTHPYARAIVRLQADHIARNLVPAFYRYLQAQDLNLRFAAGKEYLVAMETLLGLFDRAEREILGGGGITGEGERKALAKGLGLWIEGNEELGWADVMGGPWLFRSANVLTYYRGFEFPQDHSYSLKLDKYLAKLLTNSVFARTCSTDELYIDSYERYAFNRPNTSQVATAINSGRGLP